MRLPYVSRACAAAAVACGPAVLAGWTLGSPALKSLVPGFPAAQPMTAVTMILTGAALALLGVRRAGARIAVFGLVFGVVAVAILTLLAYAGVELGMDGWLFPAQVSQQPTTYRYPGRMGEVTAICFLLLAAAIAAKAVGRAVRIAVAAATTVLLVGGVILLAYLISTAPLYEVLVPGVSSVALPTAVILAVLAVGVLTAEPVAGWPRLLSMDTAGGAVSRALLPWTITVPLVLAVVGVIATRQGYISTDFRLAAICAATTIAMAWLVLWAAAGIDDAKRTEAELREREEQFRSLADSLPHLAWMADATGSIYWYNRRWYEYTGETLEEMRGWGWRKVHHPDYVDGVVERIQHAWDTGEPWEDTFPLRGADGRYRWFLSRAQPLRDADGAVTRWFGSNTDITAQVETAQLQRTLLEEVSHRVKNSLGLISSLLQLQARPLEGQARAALDEAALRVHAVAQVHDQLWRGVSAEEIDLGSFLCNLSQAISAAAPRHDTACSAEPALVSADLAVPLGLFVNELLTNAYKYAYPEGEGGPVRVVGAREPEGRYRLEIVDRGRGLPADFTLTEPRESLGMRVVSTLAAQLGGELTAASADPGARFTLVFPVLREGAPAAAPAASARRVATESSSHSA